MFEKIAELINSKVSGAGAEAKIAEKGDSSIKVASDKIVDVCRALKESDEYEFNVLQAISGVDYLKENEIEVNYILASFTKNLELILKVRLSRETPMVDTVVGLWGAANFQERECYDMFGVDFVGHPDLRRILTPDDWEGFPLRKDYVVQEKYHNMVVNPPEKAFDFQTGGR